MEEIYIEPPSAGVETNEDSADQDTSFGNKVDKSSLRQLEVGAESVLRSGKHIGVQNEEEQHPEICQLIPSMAA